VEGGRAPDRTVAHVSGFPFSTVHARRSTSPQAADHQCPMAQKGPSVIDRGAFLSRHKRALCLSAPAGETSKKPRIIVEINDNTGFFPSFLSESN
jgi:hypothetical protein